MKRTSTIRTRVGDRFTLTPVKRWVVLAVCALGWWAAPTSNVTAQLPDLRDAFNQIHKKLSESDEPPVSESGETAPPGSSEPVLPAPAIRLAPQLRQPNEAAAGVSSMEELLPATVPFAGTEADAGLQLTKNDKGLITLIVRDKSLSQVLALIAQTQHLNIVASNDIDALVSITLRDVPIEQALTAILSVANYTWVKRNNIILITSLTEAMNLPPDVQGRQIQVFELDFAKAADVEKVITTATLLSPIGKVSIAESAYNDNRRTREVVVVEDLPDTLARIAAYIAQVDQPPRQVLIEAHVLEVKLKDNVNCGVNLSNLIRIAGSDLNISTTGFADENASTAFLATLSGGNLGGVIEMLQTTSDAKSLGSPKVLVLNGQESYIQVGETIYYSQTTTTETSSQQGAASVETGVILRLTPRITHDNCVLLRVKPEVSSTDGARPTPELPPNISRTELQTDVMLRNGQGMIIGGLIRESDAISQNKVPYLGNVKGIGFLFRRSEVVKERAEIIVALVPRIQPYDCEYQNFEQGELVKATVPLLHGPLWRTDRPWDPVLPDGKRVSYPLIPSKFRPGGQFYGLGSNYVVPPTPLMRQRLCDDDCGPCESESGGPVEALPMPGGNMENQNIIYGRP